MKKPLFQKVSVIGVGLLGASIAMALKERKLAASVCGYFRHRKKIAVALRKKAVDEGTDRLDQAVRGAELIILCSPVEDIIAVLKCLKKNPVPGALITDVGSTKQEIVKASAGLNFVGGHPLAGSERGGIEFARPDLFEQAPCILTTDRVSQDSLSRTAVFWKALGAKVVTMTSRQHDQALAFTSHLPHALAYALIAAVPERFTRFSAGGLKDTTRIALSKPGLWSGIFLTNRGEILKSLSAFEKSLNALKSAIAENRRTTLLRLLSQAQKKRNSCLPFSK
ncbi:MAG: prephenate dehydrogenase/arogenate dehydrogenase family protein [Candidatus Omnitrophota bacterium]